jgi:hypothetical protein
MLCLSTWSHFNPCTVLQQANLHLYERFIKLVGEPEGGKSSTRTRGLPWVLRIVDDVYDSYAAAEAAWEKQVGVIIAACHR